MINPKEYKDISIETMLEKTGLPNPYADQTRFSLARQKELILRDAQKNNVLHLIPKSCEIKHGVINVSTDKGVSILTKREEERIVFTSELDLNSIPHKVIREKGYRTIIVNAKDIPMNVVPHPSKPYAYNVDGIFEKRKCFYSHALREDSVHIGKVFRFGFNTHLRMHILF